MFIDELVWLPDIIEKLEAKHHVRQDEVEEVDSKERRRHERK